MLTTLSIIKADVGSIGGHVTPGRQLLDTIGRHVSGAVGGLISDYFLGVTGDDVAILMAHKNGVGDEEVHRLAWEAFRAGTRTAKAQGLYGAGQDLLVDAFSGYVKGMGPAVAEMEFEERPNEPFLMFMADKTEPGAYNLPLYLAFADPMNTGGLLLSPEITKGFRNEKVERKDPPNSGASSSAAIPVQPPTAPPQSGGFKRPGPDDAKTAIVSIPPGPVQAEPAAFDLGEITREMQAELEKT